MDRPVPVIMNDVRLWNGVDMKKALVMGLTALLLSGCGQVAGGPGQSQGRYAVVQAGNRTILLDTQEGRAWELVTDAQGISRGWASIASLPAAPR
jgi:uncharacterized protein YceK